MAIFLWWERVSSLFVFYCQLAILFGGSLFIGLSAQGSPFESFCRSHRVQCERASICSGHSEDCKIKQKIYDEVLESQFQSSAHLNPQMRQEEIFILAQQKASWVVKSLNSRRMIIIPEEARQKITFRSQGADRLPSLTKDPGRNYKSEHGKELGSVETKNDNSSIVPTYEVVAYRRQTSDEDSFTSYRHPIDIALRRVDSEDKSIYWVHQIPKADKDYAPSFSGSGSIKGERRERKPGESVKLSEDMTCRTSPDFTKQNQSNVLVVLTGGLEGVIKENLWKEGEGGKSRQIIGYKIKFPVHRDELVEGDSSDDDNSLDCYVWYGGVIDGGEFKRDVEKEIQEKARASSKGGSSPSSEEAMTVCKLESCKEDNMSTISAEALSSFDDEIDKAAKEVDIDPTFLKSSIMVETSFTYFTNNFEKSLYEKSFMSRGKTPLPKYLQDYKWGKGCGMFGANNAHDWGVAWFSSLGEVLALSPELCKDSNGRKKIEEEYKRILENGLDTNAEAFKKVETLCPSDMIDHSKRMEKGYYYLGETPKKSKSLKKGESLKYSVEDHQGCVLAKARYMKYLMNCPFKKVDGKSLSTFIVDKVEKERIAIAAYNGGCGRITRAFMAFHKKMKRFPKSYSEIAPFVAQSSPNNICHVKKSMGLCGDAGGYYHKFLKEVDSPKEGEGKASEKAVH